MTSSRAGSPFDQVRLELALTAARLGSYEWDPETGEILWDSRLVEMFGYDAETFVPHFDSFSARVHPDDRATVETRLAQAVEYGEDLVLDYRIVLPDGTTRWISARGRAVPYGEGGKVRVLGLVFDSTEVHEVGEQVVRVLETMGDAFFSLDRGWNFTYLNAQGERLLGRPRSRLVGRNLWEEFPDAVGTGFEEKYRQAMEAGEAVSFEEHYPAPLDAWFEVRAFPGPDGLAVYFHDVTERRRREEEERRARAAEAASNRRLQILAESTARLSEILDPERILDALTGIVVPDLATWAVITLREDEVWRLYGEEGGSSNAVKVVRCAHSDPERLPELERIAHEARLSLEDEEGAGSVARTGEPLYYDDVPRAAQEMGVTVEEEPALAVTSRSVLVVPLVARGHVMGALTVTSDDPYLPLDQTLIEDLARRAAVALENAVLYKAEQRTAVALQRSLLPRVPHRIPGVDVASRYLPGTRGAEIGGDWYEALRRRDGRLGLVIGDVMGHSVRAAAQMGQLRLAVATLALQGQEPGELLEGLSADVDELLDLQLATVLCSVYDPEKRELLVASAGHPPILLRVPGEEPRYVELEPGPPLGVGASHYPQTSLHVPPGSTMVLYTDGLVESRDRGVDADLDVLRKVLGRVPSGSRSDRVCDALLEGTGRATGGSDDVALMVVRHP